MSKDTECEHIWRGSGISGNSVVRHCLKCGNQKLVPRSPNMVSSLFHPDRRSYPTLEEDELMKVMVEKHNLRDR